MTKVISDNKCYEEHKTHWKTRMIREGRDRDFRLD